MSRWNPNQKKTVSRSPNELIWESKCFCHNPNNAGLELFLITPVGWIVQGYCCFSAESLGSVLFGFIVLGIQWADLLRAVMTQLSYQRWSPQNTKIANKLTVIAALHSRGDKCEHGRNACMGWLEKHLKIMTMCVVLCTGRPHMEVTLKPVSGRNKQNHDQLQDDTYLIKDKVVKAFICHNNGG